MLLSDRVFGLIATLVSLAYLAAATQIPTSLLTDPVGPRGFPYLVGAVGGLCGVAIGLKPGPEVRWPAGRTLIALLVAVAVLVTYAYALPPFGFLLPTALAAGILSYQIFPKGWTALFTGLGLSAGLFVLFKYILDLGLVPLPTGLTG